MLRLLRPRVLTSALALGAGAALAACWPILGGDLAPELFPPNDASLADPDAKTDDARPPPEADATGAPEADAPSANDGDADGGVDAEAGGPDGDANVADVDAGGVVVLWNTDVPVCWMPQDVSEPADGWKAEKAAIRRDVIQSWQRYTNVHFVGWDDCPTAGTARYVKLYIGYHPNGSPLSNLLSQADGAGMDLLRPAVDPTCNADESGAPGGGRHCSSVRFWFRPDHSTAVTGPGSIQYVAVHELGHVLGFADTPYPQSCPGSAISAGVDLDPNDHPSSVMNPCGPVTGALAAGDITGAEQFYGAAAYPTLAANDRFYHDPGGAVFHQDGAGNVSPIVLADAGFGASSSVAGFSYPLSGQTAVFLDTQTPPHLRPAYLPSGGAAQVGDWGAAPAGCTWTGSPAGASWGEGRSDVVVNALCSGQLHVFHQARETTAYPWTDITPPGVAITSSPAALAREPGVLDVVVMSRTSIVHGSCTGNCDGTDGAAFEWDPPSAGMNQGTSAAWSGDPALASPSPGVVRAFAVDAQGSIDFSQWSWSAPTWTASSAWVSFGVPAPTWVCTSSSGGPAATRTAQNSIFVACTGADGKLYGGWGDTIQSGTWWFLAGPISGGGALCAH